MITTKKKRKVIVEQVMISHVERNLPFEIRLPANVKRVTGILVTTRNKQWEG